MLWQLYNIIPNNNMHLQHASNVPTTVLGEPIIYILRQHWKLQGNKKRFSKKGFAQNSLAQKNLLIMRNTQRAQGTSPTRVMQQAEEVSGVASRLPPRSCPTHSPFQSAVCAVVPRLGPGPEAGISHCQLSRGGGLKCAVMYLLLLLAASFWCPWMTNSQSRQYAGMTSLGSVECELCTQQ